MGALKTSALASRLPPSMAHRTNGIVLMSITRVVPWIIGNCSFYAIERNGVCLPEEFMELLHAVNADSGLRLLRIINTLCNEEHIAKSTFDLSVPRRERLLSITTVRYVESVTTEVGSCARMLAPQVE